MIEAQVCLLFFFLSHFYIWFFPPHQTLLHSLTYVYNFLFFNTVIIIIFFSVVVVFMLLFLFINTHLYYLWFGCFSGSFRHFFSYFLFVFFSLENQHSGVTTTITRCPELKFLKQNKKKPSKINLCNYL